MEAASAHSLFALVAMWVAMMAAMMLPSSAPMVSVYAGAVLQRSGRAYAVLQVGAFLLGYVTIWGLYGAAAAFLQLGLDRAGLLSQEMDLASGRLKGLVLVAAGAYQWTSLKHLCLERCRSPLSFILLYWRNGLQGAFTMGMRHGSYCVGCCWALMLLLFAGGVMNLWLIAGLVALVLIERLLRKGAALARLAGALMGAAGVYILLAGA